MKVDSVSKCSISEKVERIKPIGRKRQGADYVARSSRRQKTSALSGEQKYIYTTNNDLAGQQVVERTRKKSEMLKIIFKIDIRELAAAKKLMV